MLDSKTGSLERGGKSGQQKSCGVGDGKHSVRGITKPKNGSDRRLGGAEMPSCWNGDTKVKADFRRIAGIHGL